jgi:hypothetical protein
MQALLFGFDRFSSFDAVRTVLLDLFFGNPYLAGV